MRISKKHIFGGLVLVVLQGSAHAQNTMRVAPMAVHQVNDVTTSEQINQLIAQVAQLQSRLAADEAKLQQATQTATDAKMAAGFINTGFDQQLKSMTADYDGKLFTMNANISVMNANFTSLEAAYKVHTHKYAKRLIEFNTVQFDGKAASYIFKDVDDSEATSPPQ